ncbi:hypothetical protein QBC43DRAFT_50140 [Cladorrhinum sp. PSN259]|nr:hypothetical protein QBC43DRAFT_50140 [Cladorrhinum sp. PSN259]
MQSDPGAGSLRDYCICGRCGISGVVWCGVLCVPFTCFLEKNDLSAQYGLLVRTPHPSIHPSIHHVIYPTYVWRHGINGVLSHFALLIVSMLISYRC